MIILRYDKNIFFDLLLDRNKCKRFKDKNDLLNFSVFRPIHCDQSTANVKNS